MMKYYFVQTIILIFAFSFTGSNTKDENFVSSDSAIQIMLLSIYHFDNPGFDKHNLQIDDYFSEKRQKEISDVVTRLSGFDPNKIFIEQLPSSQNKIDSLYNAFLNNELSLNEIKGGINEIYQIGFNLGKKTNVTRMDCIDAAGNWLGPYADFIADTIFFKEYSEEEDKSKSDIAERNEKFNKQTIRENLIF